MREFGELAEEFFGEFGAGVTGFEIDVGKVGTGTVVLCDGDSRGDNEFEFSCSIFR